jgi:hypothetical protein
MSYPNDGLYKPLDPVYRPKSLYEPIKIDPLPTYKPLDLEPVYRPKPLYDPVKLDPLPTYKPPEPKLLGRWCSRKGAWCYEPVCRCAYGLPGKHAHTHLIGHHHAW